MLNSYDHPHFGYFCPVVSFLSETSSPTKDTEKLPDTIFSLESDLKHLIFTIWESKTMTSKGNAYEGN